MELNGKVALVLGAIKGIGKGIALALAQQGVNVALNYFDWEEELEGLQKDFSNTPGQSLIVQTNLLEVDKIPGHIYALLRQGKSDAFADSFYGAQYEGNFAV